MGERGDSTEVSTESVLRFGMSGRFGRDALDRALRPDLTDAASAVLSPESPFDRMAEVRGLSSLPLPGILDRRERNDRDDSFVSDLLNDGYFCRLSPTEAPGPLDEPLSLEL